MATKTPTKASKQHEAITEAIKQLHALPRTLAGEITRLQRHPDYSNSYKTRLITQARDQYVALGRDLVESSVSALKSWRKAAQRRAQEAQAATEGRWDYSRLAVLADEYRSQLGGQAAGYLGTGGSVRKLAELHERARALNDPHRLRALRMAAPAVLDAVHGSNDTAAAGLASQIRAELAKDEEAERPAELVEAEADLKSADFLERLLAGQIGQTETELGLGGGVWGTGAWTRDILGDLNGGGVMPVDGAA